MSVQRFFESMDAFFRTAAGTPDDRAAATRALTSAHAGWDASPSRLGIYARFVDAHVRDTLEKNFPLVRGVVGEESWSKLVRAFYETSPARHFEINQLCASFPAFVGDVVEAWTLPTFLPALARFEWTDFEVYASTEEIPSTVAALTANPTLAVLQHPWRLVPWIRTETSARPSTPESGDETVLLWRHPKTHHTMYLAADPGALLVLKMALEGISEDAAANAGAMSVEQVRAIVATHARDGLVLTDR